MRHRLYSHWKLRHFIAQFTGLDIKLRQNTLADIKAAIDTALPGLRILSVEKYMNA